MPSIGKDTNCVINALFFWTHLSFGLYIEASKSKSNRSASEKISVVYASILLLGNADSNKEQIIEGAFELNFVTLQ